MPENNIAERLLELHNKYRAGRRLPPLRLSPQLQVAAQAHADHMAKVGRLRHQWIGDGTPYDRMVKAGYNFSRAAENVAWNQATTEQVMTAWMGSWGHRMNIMGNYLELGAAVAYGARGDSYWCVDFGTPKTIT